MTDAECTAFLQWALPKLDRRWSGYRKVRRLVAKRLARRLRAVGLADLDAYRAWLGSHRSEWDALDALLGIPISRFYRDRGVFASIERAVLPALAQAARDACRSQIVCWSAGCASGEEPYTLAILWRSRVQPAFPQLALRVIATDCDAALVERARTGCYAASSLKELPADLRAAAFEQRSGLLCVRSEYRSVEFLRQDLRAEMPDGPFDLVCLRNVVATYYAAEVQREIVARIAHRMHPGAVLVLGIHETLPEGVEGFAPSSDVRAVFRKSTS
jgi:chemotaxis protein methyltransferase CheR